VRFDLKAPCADCPFLREGGIRLGKARTREIAEGVTGNPGASFACHKTTGAAGPRPRSGEEHCVGALVFAGKVGSYSQILRIMGRLGAFDPDDLEKRHGSKVFASLREWLREAI
jgi:hypothetical protein